MEEMTFSDTNGMYLNTNYFLLRIYGLILCHSYRLHIEKQNASISPGSFKISIPQSAGLVPEISTIVY